MGLTTPLTDGETEAQSTDGTSFWRSWGAEAGLAPPSTQHGPGQHPAILLHLAKLDLRKKLSCGLPGRQPHGPPLPRLRRQKTGLTEVVKMTDRETQAQIHALTISNRENSGSCLTSQASVSLTTKQGVVMQSTHRLS